MSHFKAPDQEKSEKEYPNHVHSMVATIRLANSQLTPIFVGMGIISPSIFPDMCY